jgi:aminotransferase in exopolysaccharide biosynthesis
MFEKFEAIIAFIRKHYNQPEGTIPLHEPRFSLTDRQYVLDAIDSTYVSSVGRYVDQFESLLAAYTGATHAVAVVNGTSALHIALMLANVKKNDLVITQPLSFIATCNAITYTGAEPLFVDIDPKTLGMSATALREFLNDETVIKNNSCFHKQSGRKIAACVPMHTFGHPAEIDTIAELCAQHHIALIEDAAESIGSFYKNKHTGCFGLMGVFSFNGNKTITCGGGGAIITNNRELALKAKHLTTQAKVPHRWAFVHDMIGYNYRLPNLNAALACSQLEQLPSFLENKRATAAAYKTFFDSINIAFVEEPPHARSNYWLNAILFSNQDERNAFLEFSNNQGIMTRPAWTLINKLPMYSHCIVSDLANANEIESRLVNIPSSVKQS